MYLLTRYRKKFTDNDFLLKFIINNKTSPEKSGIVYIDSYKKKLVFQTSANKTSRSVNVELIMPDVIILWE